MYIAAYDVTAAGAHVDAAATIIPRRASVGGTQMPSTPRSCLWNFGVVYPRSNISGVRPKAICGRLVVSYFLDFYRLLPKIGTNTGELFR
jgi:hypothetical protein